MTTVHCTQGFAPLCETVWPDSVLGPTTQYVYASTIRVKRGKHVYSYSSNQVLHHCATLLRPLHQPHGVCLRDIPDHHSSSTHPISTLDSPDQPIDIPLDQLPRHVQPLSQAFNPDKYLPIAHKSLRCRSCDADVHLKDT